MYISGVNIAVTYPDTARTIKALESLDFCVAAVHSMNPTTAWADIVLPKTTTLEEEEVTISGAGACVGYTQPAHAPCGEAKCDLEIASLLVDALAERGALYKNFVPWKTQREFNQHLIGDSGISLDALQRNGFAEFPVERGNFDNHGFATPTGKVELFSTTLDDLGQDPLPDYVAPVAPSQDFPLVLLTGEREKNYHHSRFREQSWARDHSADPTIKLHPDTAREAHVDADQWVEIQTSVGKGRFKARALITDRIKPGFLGTGMGWWRPEDDGPYFGALDINVNTILSYQGKGDPITGSVDSRGLPCRMSLVSQVD